MMPDSSGSVDLVAVVEVHHKTTSHCLLYLNTFSPGQWDGNLFTCLTTLGHSYLTTQFPNSPTVSFLVPKATLLYPSRMKVTKSTICSCYRGAIEDTIFKKEIKTSLSHREALRQCFYLVGYNYYQLCQPLELH